MGALRRFFAKLSESDEALQSEEVRSWAETIEGSVRIIAAPSRESVKVAGTVKRLTIFPVQGEESLEALVSDGTGEIVVVFMGRRGIHGLTLGTRVVVVGVVGERFGKRRMINPKLELSS